MNSIIPTLTERECKTCKQTKDMNDFYRYWDDRLYNNCKKCHNKTRNNYARKRSQNPRSTTTTMVMQSPSGTARFFAFDFVNNAIEALGVQTNVGSVNPEEVKVGSS